MVIVTGFWNHINLVQMNHTEQKLWNPNGWMSIVQG